jgi:hypothetical protein
MLMSDSEADLIQLRAETAALWALLTSAPKGFAKTGVRP